MALYHSARGSVDYTVVGTPTIVDGVASGFSSSNYLKTQELPSYISIKGNIKARYSNILSEYQGICSVGNLSNTVRFELEDRNSVRLRYTDTTSTNKYVNVAPNLSANEYFNIYFEYQNNSLYVLTEQNGIKKGENTFSNVAAPTGLVNLGIVVQAFTTGSIDLNETYIKVNGQPWFGVCPIEVKKHQLMGPVGYTKVGSPTITDGILNLPTSSDYIRTNASTINWNDVDCEFFTKATPGKYPPAGGSILISFGQGAGNNLNFIENRLWVVNRGDITPQERYTLNFTEQNFVLGTYYYIRFKKVGSIVSLAWSVDKVNWTEQTSNIGSSTNTFVSTGNIQYGKNDYLENEQYSGSIDLNETYIKVNGKLWYYQPAPTKYIVKDDKLVFADNGLYLSGPVNYTVVGTPTIVDGVLGNLSVEDYVKVDSITYNSNSSLEVYTRFKTPTTAQKGFHLITSWGSYSGQIGLYRSSADSNMVLYANVAQVGGTIYQIGFLVNGLALNTWYRAKMSSDNSTWTVTLYEDSGTQLESKSAQLTFGDFTSNINIGRPYGGLNPVMQEIDLKETYIKLDGNLYFYGKNYASKNIAPVPSGYTYGNTTTSAIGFVDMRTQAFTAAPSGATIGRDE